MVVVDTEVLGGAIGEGGGAQKTRLHPDSGNTVNRSPSPAELPFEAPWGHSVAHNGACGGINCQREVLKGGGHGYGSEMVAW